MCSRQVPFSRCATARLQKHLGLAAQNLRRAGNHSTRVSGGKAKNVDFRAATQGDDRMKQWSSAKGWAPRRTRIDLAVWRWVLIPAITAAILLTAAFLATFAKADEWICTGTSICFDRAGIVYSNTDPGQMLVRASDIKTGEGGWIAVDCVARIAMANSPVFTIEDGSPLGNLCDTIGSDE